MAAGDSSLAALSLEAVKGFRDFADGKAEHVSGLTAPDARTVRVELDHAALGAARSSCRARCCRWSIPTTDRRATSATSTSAARGRWSSSDDGDLRARQPRPTTGSLAGVELQRLRRRRRRLRRLRGRRRRLGRGAGRPSYDDAVEEYGDDAFAPFQAELFFGMNVERPGARSRRPLRQAIVLAIDRRGDRRRRSTPTWPTRSPPSSPPASPATIPTAARLRPRPRRRRPTSSRSPSPTATCPTVHIDFDESPAQEAMAEMVADDLEAAGIPTELRPKPLDEYKAFVVSGDQELFSFGWIGAYRVARRLPRAAVRLVRQRQPHRLPVRPGGRPARAAPGPAPTPPRTPSGGPPPSRRSSRPHVVVPDRPVPHPGGRRRPGRRASSTPSTAPSTGPR